MDEGGKCRKVESVCVVNNGNTRHDLENNATSDPTAHKHPTTNHECLQRKILQENNSREELHRRSPGKLRRSNDADLESRTEKVVNCWDELVDTPIKDSEAKNLMGV
jgi:hypothetical protein